MPKGDAKEGVMIEVWKDVHGYEGMYQVSDVGCVRSLRYATSQGLMPRATPARKQTRKDRLGYEIINLGRNGGTKTYRVHQLVARAFLPPPPKRGSVLRHVDGDKENNAANNLAWGSQQDNIEDSRRHGVLKGAPVIGFFEDGSIRVYDYAAHAANDGLSPPAISACIAGRQNTHGGARWMRLGKEAFGVALREMIEAAKAEEREAIIAEMPGGHSVDPQWVCDMIRARG